MQLFIIFTDFVRFLHCSVFCCNENGAVWFCGMWGGDSLLFVKEIRRIWEKSGLERDYNGALLFYRPLKSH